MKNPEILSPIGRITCIYVMRYLHVITIDIEKIRIKKKTRSFFEVNKPSSTPTRIKLWRFIDSWSMLYGKFKWFGFL